MSRQVALNSRNGWLYSPEYASFNISIKYIEKMALQLAFIFLSAGTSFSIYTYHVFNRFEYPFYYNFGIRFNQLIIYTIIINIALILFAAIIYSLIGEIL